jgi:hypothetical protein
MRRLFGGVPGEYVAVLNAFREHEVKTAHISKEVI